MTKRILVGVTCVLITVAVSAAYGQTGCCAVQGNCPMIAGQLTPDQQKQLTELRIDFLKKQEAVRAELSKKRIELLEMASKQNSDEDAIEKKRQEIWSLQDSLRNESRQLSAKFRSMLTPEQKQKMGPMGLGMGAGGGRFNGSGMGMGCGMGAGCPMGAGPRNGRCCGASL
jgi:Spy/CpxP family protein refolding chaperone